MTGDVLRYYYLQHINWQNSSISELRDKLDVLGWSSCIVISLSKRSVPFEIVPRYPLLGNIRLPPSSCLHASS